MRVALFIPCYIDQFYPQVAIATLELLEKVGCDVFYPKEQTCCGQPMANSGFSKSSAGCNENFVRNFLGFDYIVAPSGSCVLHIKEHLKSDNEIDSAQVRSSIFELTEFLTDILKIKNLTASFPHKVGLHTSCHGQRGLNLSSASEIVSDTFFSKPEQLLRMVRGLELVYPKRKDECCGFGGTFCISEEAVSVKMGKDRILEHESLGVSYITGGDISCLMHLEGILKRNKSNIRTIHIAEILNSCDTIPPQR